MLVYEGALTSGPDFILSNCIFTFVAVVEHSVFSAPFLSWCLWQNMIAPWGSCCVYVGFTTIAETFSRLVGGQKKIVWVEFRLVIFSVTLMCWSKHPPTALIDTLTTFESYKTGNDVIEGCLWRPAVCLYSTWHTSLNKGILNKLGIKLLSWVTSLSCWDRLGALGLLHSWPVSTSELLHGLLKARTFCNHAQNACEQMLKKVYPENIFISL